MASLTIRKLDEAIKIYLRMRAARNGRSVEEEVRGILREYTDGRLQPASPTAQPAPAPTPQRERLSGEARVTLIIGGGIAAYKSLDLIRRLKERHVRVRCVLTRAATQFVTPLSVARLGVLLALQRILEGARLRAGADDWITRGYTSPLYVRPDVAPREAGRQLAAALEQLAERG